MKLLNLNICIKISNTKEVGNFLIEQNADFVTIQEIVRHLEPGVFEEYRSKEETTKVTKGTKIFTLISFLDLFG